MTMLAGFTPGARETLVRAGILAAEAGHDGLGTDFMLLALTEARPADPCLGDPCLGDPCLGDPCLGDPCLGDPCLRDLGVTAAEVRAEIEGRQGRRPRPPDGELLATLGIDLDEVRHRVSAATSTRRDDPALWRLHRSRLRPLRVTLTGPAIEVALNAGGRKVIEVAGWAARRSGRGLADRGDLLLGLLADGTNESVRILCALDVNLHRLWAGLRDGRAAA